MLRSLEIQATLSTPSAPDHLPLLSWSPTIELSLDCFVCVRVGRTTRLERGSEQAICSSDRDHGPHFAPARIAEFDPAQASVRAVVEFWWAPFHDAKRDTPATPLSEAPWVRLHLAYQCPLHEAPGTASTQTNLVRPTALRCEHCAAVIATSHEAPAIRLLG
ncbi:MAG: hypothetical protein HOV86_28720 [Thermoactinospora sp.]|nr:hypothetical protein [Thermoactinospora sp.]